MSLQAQAAAMMREAKRDAERRIRWGDVALFGAVFLVFVTVMPGQVRSDALHPFWAIEAAFPERGLIPHAFPDLGDRRGMTLGMVPLYFVGRLLASACFDDPHKAAQAIELIISVTNPFAIALTVVVLASLQRRLGVPSRLVAGYADPADKWTRTLYDIRDAQIWRV